MSLPTKHKQSEQLATQENVENNHKQNSILTEREPIKGTPFTLIKQDEQWFMVMGDYRVTETTKTKEEQIEKLESEKWLLIMHICIVAIKKIGIENNDYKNWEERMKKLKENTTDYETESL